MIQPGTLFEDRYEVVRHVGAGSFATVYEVRHVGLQSRHALKVLDDRLAEREDLRNRFLSEGRIQAQVRHPGIVAVTDTVTSPRPGLVMEYVEGTTLEHHLAEAGVARTPDEVVALMSPILDGVGAAHEAGVVHRDLKPQNILIAVGPGGRLRPQVADFGIAKVLDDAAVLTGKNRTETGVAMGTLLYMSPEQIRGDRDLDLRSDIFSLGAILYEVVTGRVAFDSASQYEAMKRIVDGNYEPPERFVGALDPAFADCIRMALAVNPDERFQSCEAFRSALEGIGDPRATRPHRPLASAATTMAPPTPPRPISTAEQEAATRVYQEPHTAKPRPPGPPPRRKKPGTAVALEMVPGLFGFFGIGHMYNGRIVLGLLVMVSYWILQFFNILLLFVGIGFLTLPLTLLVYMVLSAWKASVDADEANLLAEAAATGSGDTRSG